MSPSEPTTLLSPPTWGLDWQRYAGVCRYLGFTPSPVSPALHEKLARYLLQTAATRPAPVGFARRLAELHPGRMTLGFLDAWPRPLMPAHPWRYRLNAVIALHECDPTGYREMMAGAGTGLRVWISAATATLSYTLGLIPGLLWLAGQGAGHLFSGRALRREQEAFDTATVLVTGASRGLGLALVARLLSLGAQVVALARDSAALRALGEQATQAGFGERLRVAAADVSAPGAVRQALAALGLDGSGVDAVIANAGVKQEATGAADEEALARTLAVNLFGALHAVNAVLPDWRARGRGRLVFISSIGRWHGMVRSGAYNASKAALSILAESLAMDLRDEGADSIGITIVEPGLIRTGMVASGGLQGLLSVGPEDAARRILQCPVHSARTCRFPMLFTLMTAAIAMLPTGQRVRVLAQLGRAPLRSPR
jgi:NAD(P)-dependent dehydrogenase (short-subunit alcohol dehydrogenase family)